MVVFIPSEEWQGDPREVLKGCPVGAMLPMISRQTNESPIEVAFGIREESQRIPFINNNPIAIRMAVLEEKGVFLIPIIIRLSYMGFFTEYFECWLNIYPEDSIGAEIFRIISRQTRMVLQLLGDSGEIERIMILPHNYREYWSNLESVIDRSQSWSDEEFEQAREEIYKRFATPKDLFNHLGEFC